MKLLVPLSLVILSGVLHAGSLPQLDDKPWTGWFAAHEARKFTFGVHNNGEGQYLPELERGKKTSTSYAIEFEPVIEELRGGGKIVTKKNERNGWEAVTEASAEAEKIVYRGTSTGGAKFEVTLEVDGKEIRGGGRILDRGELTEHPIQLAIRVKVPNVYRHKKDDEAVEDLAEGDDVRLVRVDGKELKFDALEPVDAASAAVTGPGIREVRVDLEGYKGQRIEMAAGEGGRFELWNYEERPLYKGFTVGWKHDPAKDPEGKARFSFVMK